MLLNTLPNLCTTRALIQRWQSVLFNLWHPIVYTYCIIHSHHGWGVSSYYFFQYSEVLAKNKKIQINYIKIYIFSKKWILDKIQLRIFRKQNHNNNGFEKNRIIERRISNISTSAGHFQPKIQITDKYRHWDLYMICEQFGISILVLLCSFNSVHLSTIISVIFLINILSTTTCYWYFIT